MATRLSDSVKPLPCAAQPAAVSLVSLALLSLDGPSTYSCNALSRFVELEPTNNVLFEVPYEMLGGTHHHTTYVPTYRQQPRTFDDVVSDFP